MLTALQSYIGLPADVAEALFEAEYVDDVVWFGEGGHYTNCVVEVSFQTENGIVIGFDFETC